MRANPFKDYNDFIRWAELSLANEVIKDGFSGLGDTLRNIIFIYNTHFVGDKPRPMINDETNDGVQKGG